MDLRFRVTRALHDDHVAVLGLLANLSGHLDRTHPATVPGRLDGRLAAVLSELAVAVEGEITDHFALEEGALFPLLEAAGEGGLGQLLTEEHEVILPLGRRVAELARAGVRDGFDADGWAEFRRLGRDFAAELSAHAEKEEIGLVPLLDELLDAETDERIAAAYLAGGPSSPRVAAGGGR